MAERSASEMLPAQRETFCPTDRIKRRADFRHIQSRGIKIHTPHFILSVWRRPCPAHDDAVRLHELVPPDSDSDRSVPPDAAALRRGVSGGPSLVEQASAGAVRTDVCRLGITVTRKIANAVGRNRVKRVLREVFRRNRGLFPRHCDVVVIAKEGAPALGYDEVLAEMRRVQSRLQAPIGSRRNESTSTSRSRPRKG